MSGYDHKAVPQQGENGGYHCILCSDETVLLIGANEWMHKDEAPVMKDFPGERRSPVKSFTPQPVFAGIAAEVLFKNRREALFCASHLDQDGYNDENDLLETAEKFERWLNRPQDEFWYDHDDDKKPTPLRVIEDEVADL